MAGEQGLMIFATFDHGAALNMVDAPRNAKQYLIGDPLTVSLDQKLEAVIRRAAELSK